MFRETTAKAKIEGKPQQTCTSNHLQSRSLMGQSAPWYNILKAGKKWKVATKESFCEKPNPWALLWGDRSLQQGNALHHIDYTINQCEADEVATMGDKRVETLCSKIRFLSVLVTFYPLPSKTVLIFLFVRLHRPLCLHCTQHWIMGAGISED